MLQFNIVILLALVLDFLFGDPRYRMHPVRLIGDAIRLLTRGLRRRGLNQMAGGMILVFLTLIPILTVYWAVALFLSHITGAVVLLFDVYVAYSCLALKDLFDHADRVFHPLESDNLIEARKAIAMVVGRDVRLLDETGIGRAAVETLAENFVDGFISPVFWYVGGGILGYALGASPLVCAVSFMLGFKTISTLDSMVGYKNAQFIRFGRAGAKCDDFMNFLPARLAVILLFIGAWICRSNAIQGLRVALRDRKKHDSPNAAHAESFLAGALSIRLGGPTAYPHGTIEKPWLGAEHADAATAHIREAITLLKYTAWTTVVLPLAASLIGSAF